MPSAKHPSLITNLPLAYYYHEPFLLICKVLSISLPSQMLDFIAEIAFLLSQGILYFLQLATFSSIFRKLLQDWPSIQISSSHYTLSLSFEALVTTISECMFLCLKYLSLKHPSLPINLKLLEGKCYLFALFHCVLRKQKYMVYCRTHTQRNTHVEKRGRNSQR